MINLIKPVYAAQPSDYFESLNQKAAPSFTGIQGITVSQILTGGSFSIVDLLFFLVGFAFFLSFSWAGIGYIMANGDAKKVASANARLTNSLLGLAIVFVSFVLVRIISFVFGFGNVSQTTFG